MSDFSNLDLYDLLPEDDPSRPSIASAGDLVGVGLPDDVQAGALYSPDRAIRLGAELLRLGLLLREADEASRGAALKEYAGSLKRGANVVNDQVVEFLGEKNVPESVREEVRRRLEGRFR